MSNLITKPCYVSPRLKVGPYTLVPFGQPDIKVPTHWAWFGGKAVTFEQVRLFAYKNGYDTYLYDEEITHRGH